jgi:hypothetical protein
MQFDVYLALVGCLEAYLAADYISKVAFIQPPKLKSHQHRKAILAMPANLNKFRSFVL